MCEATVKQFDIKTESMSLNVLLHRSNMAALVSSHIPVCLEPSLITETQQATGGRRKTWSGFDKGQSVTLSCFVTLLTLTPFDMDSLPEQITLTTEQRTPEHRLSQTHTHIPADLFPTMWIFLFIHMEELLGKVLNYRALNWPDLQDKHLQELVLF